MKKENEMKIKVVADSCCDLLKNQIDEETLSYASVPLTIRIDDVSYVDDEHLDVSDMLKRMNASNQLSTTGCPSPGAFAREFIQESITFCVTLSSELSGSFNSAITARKIVNDENPEKKVFVFDSLSASAGEILLVLKIKELVTKGFSSVESVVKTIESCRDNMVTFFAINKFDNFVKSGRMSKLDTIFASVLSIRPICGDDGAGKIKVYEKVRGEKSALRRIVEMIGERKDPTGQTMVITHCNNDDGAFFIKEYAKQLYDLKDILIFPMRGLSTFYANDRGIMLSV
jgi:DegV family protein with EDD domain